MLQELAKRLSSEWKRLGYTIPKPYPHAQRTLYGVCLITLACALVLLLSYALLWTGQFVWHASTEFVNSLGNPQEQIQVLDKSPTASAPSTQAPRPYQEGLPHETKSLFPFFQRDQIPDTQLFKLAASYALRDDLYFDTFPYVEYASNFLFAERKVDRALLQAFSQLDITNEQLFVFTLERRSKEQGYYLFQRVRVQTDQKIDTVYAAIKDTLDNSTRNTNIELISKHTLLIKIDDTISHVLYILPSSIPFTMPPKKGAPRISIVIDDLGESTRIANRLLRLNIPITFSIWPYSTKAKQVATMAHTAGHEVFIHQPMEPMKYPKVNPGENALLVSMTKETISKTLLKSMERVPFSVGLNNHMGSRFTINKTSSSVVVDILSKKGYMVLDSLTHPRSVFAEVANAKGISALERTLFLDDTSDSSSALKNLYRAERIAKNTGFAIIIGHPRGDTLKALETWIKNRDKTIHIVPLRYQKPFKP